MFFNVKKAKHVFAPFSDIRTHISAVWYVNILIRLTCLCIHILSGALVVLPFTQQFNGILRNMFKFGVHLDNTNFQSWCQKALAKSQRTSSHRSSFSWDCHWFAEAWNVIYAIATVWFGTIPGGTSVCFHLVWRLTTALRCSQPQAGALHSTAGHADRHTKDG